MNRHYHKRLIAVMFIVGLAFFMSYCKKEKDDEKPAVPSAPTATTGSASLVSQYRATLNGRVTANNLTTTVAFEYDTAKSYKNRIAGTPVEVSGNTSTAIKANLRGLTPNTVYYFRIKAENQLGITYGKDTSFTTLDAVETYIGFNPGLTYGSVEDIEGNIYKTIQIGSQIWMAENLKTITYNDGTEIPFVPDITEWSGLSTPAYSWYDNDTVVYGAFYNWHAVATGKLCPTGWHVPDDDEWTELTTFLGGSAVAGGKMKESGTAHWISPNSGADNQSGFTALPGGYRLATGDYNSIRRHGFWWSSTESSANDSWCRSLYHGYPNIDRSRSSKKSGLSVRCIKD
ncbi:MAG: hypothetical protein HPY62_09670 [Bacteroidales bacterium]|nr:hypothetical protein [Bacteroidales bacterium]